MEILRQIQKKYCSRAMASAIFIGLFFILAGLKPIGKGLILGTVFSIVNFILMGETLPLRMGRGRGKTYLFSLGSILLRYLLLAIPVIMAIKLDQYNLFAVMAGIFLVQAFILGDHVYNHISSARSK